MRTFGQFALAAALVAPFLFALSAQTDKERRCEAWVGPRTCATIRPQADRGAAEATGWWLRSPEEVARAEARAAMLGIVK